MTPVVARNATQVLALKAPSSVRNSPTKPLVPGRPTLAMREHHEARGVERHAVDEPAVGGDLARVHAVVDDADAQEQRGRDEAVRQHLEDRAVDALLVKREDAHRHEAHVGDGGIGDQLLHVLLRQRHQRGVDDGDDRQREDSGAKSWLPSGNIGSEKRRKP